MTASTTSTPHAPVTYAPFGGARDVDLRSLWYAARRGRMLLDGTGFSVPPYAPEGEARLHLARARVVGSRACAYADYAVYEVPFTGKLTADSRRRVQHLLYAAQSTNGYAGYGSSWDLESVDEARGVLVIVQRSSIPD